MPPTSPSGLYPLPPALPSASVVALFFPWWAWYLARFLRECRLASDVFWEEMTRNPPQGGAGTSGLHATGWSAWLGRPMDLKDAQWHAFRDGMPILTAVLGAMILARRVVAPPGRGRTWVGIAFSLGLAVYLHRAGAVISLAMATGGFVCSKVHPWVGFSWALGTLVLIKVHGGLEPEVEQIMPGVWRELTRVMGSRVLPWHACYPLMMLRMVSFAMDSPPQATFLTYLLYVYYAPLYATGPIIRAVDFFKYEVERSKPPPSFRGIVLPYLIRFVVDLLVFELFSSYFYVTALTRMLAHNWRALTPTLYRLTHEDYSVMAHVSFCALIGVWFKFLLVWRYARLAAMLDGIDPPENMRRCIANNYSVRGFWRDWHCSFNSWLVRYMYVPLGGSRAGVVRQFLAVVMCFAFVALWHDLEPRMAAWAGILSVLILPEIICARWSSTSPMALRWQKVYPYRWLFLEGLAGGIAIVGLQVVNMIGYTNGLDAAKTLLLDSQLFKSWEGRWFALRWLLDMSAAACIMQRIRVWERHTLEDDKLD